MVNVVLATFEARKVKDEGGNFFVFRPSGEIQFLNANRFGVTSPCNDLILIEALLPILHTWTTFKAIEVISYDFSTTGLVFDYLGQRVLPGRRLSAFLLLGYPNLAV